MFSDNLFSSNKFAAWLLKIRVNAFFGTTPAENMVFPAAAALASGFICRFNGDERQWLQLTALSVMLLSWVLSSLLSGFLKQWYFLCFSAAFNLLPHIFLNAAETDTSQINRILVTISEFTVIFSAKPLLQLGIEAFELSAIIAGGSGALMLIGFLIRKNARSSREYCKVRLNMLSKGTEN